LQFIPTKSRPLRRSLAGLAGAALALGLAVCGIASAAERVRVAVLEYGTVNWELDTIRRHGLDREAGLELAISSFAGPQATLVALLAGQTDLAVEDWIWVARQRTEGRPFAFVPYSTATGALMAPKDSQIRSLADLAGKRVGVAGGPLDKSWLILRAASVRSGIGDLQTQVEPVYGAPPLLGEQLRAGRLDAVLTYWHYAARLAAAGNRTVLEVGAARRDLGIEPNVPMIGYVFNTDWADARRESLNRLFRAAAKARALLLESDAEWEALRPLIKAPDEATFVALRDGYRAGIPRAWGEPERAAAEKLFETLRELGGDRLAGTATKLPAGTFWEGLAADALALPPVPALAAPPTESAPAARPAGGRD
jgi:NitT/TauT family transport system substrate-binding protein